MKKEIVVGCFIFGRDKTDRTYILAVKRGKNVKQHPGMWCIPGGHYKSNETLKGACCREVFEETNCVITERVLQLYSSDVDDNTVYINYSVFLPHLSDVRISNANCEEGEIDDVKWIPVRDLHKYTWCCNLEKEIMKAYYAI